MSSRTETNGVCWNHAEPAPITIDAASAGICSISGGVVSFVGAGSCIVDANQAGNATYNPAPQVQQSFVVAPAVRRERRSRGRRRLLKRKTPPVMSSKPLASERTKEKF